MYNILNKIENPKDLKKLTQEEIKLLCEEIRGFLIEKVIKTGGHLASNLGVVELSVALHLVYDMPYDKIVWDVGHQSYVHKILTGRRDRFDTLRQYKGISGFPKTSESEYDCFNTGHSSTSVSAAIGMARARDLAGEKNKICAVFGDGAMTGGMIYEAFNDVGHHKTPMVMVLNDNGMSISKNVGALSRYLRRLRNSDSYHISKKRVDKSLSRIPVIGEAVRKSIKWVKNALRANVVPSTFFDDMGIEYLGPVDGHNVEELKKVLESAKNMEVPVLVHVITKKGKGFLAAEENPQDFHGIGPCDVIPDEKSEYKDFSACAGQTLVELAENNKKFVAITAAMPQGVGFGDFIKKYPERFFDVGIAEEHAVTFAAGLAISGITPVFAVYSSFLQRAYDQILHDVCLQNLHCVFLVDRAGIVGADGETHHGLYDISFLTDMPFMTVLAPSSFAELSKMIDYAINKQSGPVAIRYPKGTAATDIDDFEINKVNVYDGNSENVIITFGRMSKPVLLAKELLKEDNIDVKVICVSTLYPLSKDIFENLGNVKNVLVVEDHTASGGFGEIVCKEICKNGIYAKFHTLAFPDEPVIHGTVGEIDAHYGLDPVGIAKKIKEIVNV